MNVLEQIKQHTVVVADTGEVDAIQQHKPQDATTNPSLIYKAACLPQYNSIVSQAIERVLAVGTTGEKRLDEVIDWLSVLFGEKILEIVPGRVSTEVDARLSFDTKGTVSKAMKLMEMYGELGIDPNRVLIKIAATWEGIRAAEELEKRGIHCNLTLIFGFAQAAACADAGVTLISPFVGRILDWYKAKLGVKQIDIEDDPGVISVSRIYNYFKFHNYKTEVMAASFRSAEQVIALNGCDLLTISPSILTQLAQSEQRVERRLNPTEANTQDTSKLLLNEAKFRWLLNEDEMANEKLAEGIRGFASDLDQLRLRLEDRLAREAVLN